MDELIKTCRSLWHRCLSLHIRICSCTTQQHRDLAANFCCPYLVTSREERTIFASGSYFRTDLSGLRVYPLNDIKFTTRINEQRETHLFHMCVLLTQQLLNGIIFPARDANRCLCVLQTWFKQIINEFMNPTVGNWRRSSTCRIAPLLACGQQVGCLVVLPAKGHNSCPPNLPLHNCSQSHHWKSTSVQMSNQNN